MKLLTPLRNSSLRIPRWLIILLIALAGLMLEVGYTRIVSFKLWYYYTYLVIGLSLLGIGSGGILAAIWRPLKEATTERIMAVSAIWGSVSIAVGYFMVAWLPVNTIEIWKYNATSSVWNLALLVLICLALFATFIAFGIIVAVLLGRAGDQIGRMYFADLLGAGLGCMLAIPFIAWLGPPRLIMLSALVFAVVGLLALPGWWDGQGATGEADDDKREPDGDTDGETDSADSVEGSNGETETDVTAEPNGDSDGQSEALPERERTLMPISLLGVGAIATVVLSAFTIFSDLLPDVRVEDQKADPANPDHPAEYSEWGPVFRVDVLEPEYEDHQQRLLLHNASFGSGIWEFDGDESSLDRFHGDARSLPFHVFGSDDDAPANNLIIGSAGGHEILTSIFYGVDHVDAVELNPVTVSLLRDHDFYAPLSGHLDERPDVSIVQDDGRTFLARSDDSYDMVWFVAPDSYAASNPASSGGFVLSESYLYTTEMVQETLGHLTDDGLLVTQFGELSYRHSPNRTARYIVTARHALEQMGVEDPSQHIMVASQLTTSGDFSTVIVKREPFTEEEVAQFSAGVEDIISNDGDVPGIFEEPDERGQASDHLAIYAPYGAEIDDASIEMLAQGDPKAIDSMQMIRGLAGGDADEVAAWVSSYDNDISVVTDDQPFFWHFSKFGEVLGSFFESHDVFVVDPEEVLGERVMILLLAISAAYAALFLFLPFITVRRQWKRMPFKLNSGVYFSCLGLGFMLYEITMIQRLVLFLGYPTLSLTITLAAILIFTGIGALISERFVDRSRQLMPVLLVLLALLTVFYRYGLDAMTDAYLSQEIAVRILMALLVLAPLGVILGMFMPLGLGLVGKLTDNQQDYVAWSWAINGFFSVIGSVLTTMLSMMIGFKNVLVLAFIAYVIAVIAFGLLKRRSDAYGVTSSADDDPDAAGGGTLVTPEEQPLPATPSPA